jgi:hypothetical protein
MLVATLVWLNTDTRLILYMRDKEVDWVGLCSCHLMIRSLINRPGMLHRVNCPLGSTIFPSRFLLHVLLVI